VEVLAEASTQLMEVEVQVVTASTAWAVLEVRGLVAETAITLR